MRDAFRNPGAGTGFGTPSLIESTEYPLTRFSWNYTRLISLYRTSWLVRAIIDTIPEDMFKNWLNITGETEPKLLSQFDRVLRKTKSKAKLLEAMKWGRLYGGGGAVILIKGHERKLDKPLNLEDVPLDGYCGLQVFDRWSGITPDTSKLIDDITSPDYGLPEFYSIMTPDGQLATVYPRVHYTRIIRFTGRHLPQWERQAESYWGLSEVELIWDALRMSDNTQWNIASMMFTANVFVFKSGANVSQLLAATPSDIQQKVYGMLAAQRSLMNTQGMMVTDKDGGLESHQLSFSGIAEVWDKFLLILCAAAQIPKSRLLGDTQTGISSSNEGDQNTYYDSIRAKQMRELDPVMDQLLPIIAMSTWGEVPPDFGHTWNPLHSPSNQEKSDLGQKNTAAILSAFTAGVVSQRTVLMEFQQQSEITGMWSKVSDAMVEDASDDVNAMGELGLGGGDALSLGEPKPKEKKPAAAKKDEPKKDDAKKPKGKPTKDAAHSYGTVQINIDPESMAGILIAEMREKISRAHLSAEGVETEPHITVCYGLDEADIPPALVRCLEQKTSFNVGFGPVESFPEKDGSAPLYVSVYLSDELGELNREVRSSANFKKSDHSRYIPHLTLAYVKPEFVDQYSGMADLVGEDYLVTDITVVSRNDERMEVPLLGMGKAIAA